MKNFILTIFFLVAFLSAIKAQPRYQQYYDSANIYFEQGAYFSAYERFRAAKAFGKDVPLMVEKADAGMEKSIVEIRKQQEITKNALEIARREKRKSDSLLSLANKMKELAEKTVFDKAVKKYKSEWISSLFYEAYSEDKMTILSELDSLDLSNNALTGIPPEVFDCINLKYLNLSNNQIDSLPKIISSLKQLQELDLGYNIIETLPLEIKELKKLKILNLASNQLTSVPEQIVLLKELEVLNLVRNKIKDVPDNINGLNKLKSINISYNQITKLPVELSKMNSLKKIYIEGNDIENSDILPDELVEVDLQSYSKLSLNNGYIPEISYFASPNHSVKRRDSTIAIVIKNTNNNDVALAIKQLKNPRVKASAHFIIARDGEIIQLVNTDTVAWFAGRSNFNDLVSFNNIAIGIILVNNNYLKEENDKYYSWYGAEVDSSEVLKAKHRNFPTTSSLYWHKYTEEQIASTYQLCNTLLKNYSDIKYILGGEEVARGRKTDPGPAFPLDKLRNDLGLPFSAY